MTYSSPQPIYNLAIPNMEDLDLTNIHRVFQYSGNKATATHVYGWFLKVQRNRKMLQRFYADRDYQNIPALSLAAAMMDRDEFIKIHPSLKRLPFHLNPVKNTTFGVNGVHFAAPQYTESGGIHQHAAFCATYHEYRDGKKQLINKPFSVEKYGFKKALRMAIKERKEWELDHLKKMGIDPFDLRVSGHDYLDEKMAYKKIMAYIERNLDMLDEDTQTEYRKQQTTSPRR